MFKLVPATFKHEVTIKVPVDGGFEKQTIDVTYIALPISETEELLEGDRDGMKAYVRKIVHRMDGVIGEDDEVLEWNNDLARQLLDVPFVFTAVLDGYRTALNEARVKN